MSGYKHIYDLVRVFKNPRRDNCIYAFFDIEHTDIEKLNVEEKVRLCKKNGVGCIIPSLSASISPSPELFGFLRKFYKILIEEAKKNDLHVGVNLQRVLEASYFLADGCDKSIRSGVLTKLEYYHDSCDRIYSTVDMEKTMAITAYDEIFGERIDLSSKVKDGMLDYRLPEGSWTVSYYICDKKDLEFDRAPTCASRLSKEAYTKYMNYAIELLGDDVKDNFGKTVSLIYVPELCFDAPNRRDWDRRINDEFIKKYGISPSELYDSLYSSIGEITANVKSSLLDIRSDLFKGGVIDAICEFADARGIEPIYSLCEPKMPANAWLSGDALQNASSCAVLDKAYMYGLNSIKLALPATQNTDGKRVYCDIFRDYYKNSVEITYNEAINAYAQGINQLMLHSPKIDGLTPNEKDIYKIKNSNPTKSFSKFVRSAEAVLSLGKCVSDIAVMYPINSIQANVYFYQRNESKFEYPPYQIQNDYMTLMSILSVNCAQDATYIHPNDLLDECHVDGRKLIFDKTGMECRILFLPGANIADISVLSKVKEFFDAGGTVVATVMLPKYSKTIAFGEEIYRGEYDDFGEYVNKNDQALLNKLKEIFGDDATNPNVIRPYFLNENENGGRAYFIPASKTAADGSLHVQPSLIKRILEEADTPLDLYMTNLPRLMNSNGYSTTFYDFKGLGMHKSFPYGGLINNVHKKIDELDLFFFSNTASEEYRGFVYIKGKLRGRAYNPYNKKRLFFAPHFVNFKGYVYTAVNIHLRPGESMFIFSSITQERSRKNNGYPNIKYLDYSFFKE